MKPALLFFCCCTLLPAQTTERMLSACKSVVEAKLDDHGVAEIETLDYDAGLCWGTFSIVTSFGQTVPVQQKDEPVANTGFIPGLCIPQRATTTQVVAVFTSYAKAHPETYHQDATVVILKALWQAFPCSPPRSK